MTSVEDGEHSEHSSMSKAYENVDQGQNLCSDQKNHYHSNQHVRNFIWASSEYSENLSMHQHVPGPLRAA
jgi:hypothetical protein